MESTERTETLKRLNTTYKGLLFKQRKRMMKLSDENRSLKYDIEFLKSVVDLYSELILDTKKC